jgi:hypothetical protein
MYARDECVRKNALSELFRPELPTHQHTHARLLSFTSLTDRCESGISSSRDIDTSTYNWEAYYNNNNSNSNELCVPKEQGKP